MLHDLLADPKYRSEFESMVALTFILFVVYVILRMWQEGSGVENQAREPEAARAKEPLSRGQAQSREVNPCPKSFHR
jgi:hypothetical protein